MYTPYTGVNSFLKLIVSQLQTTLGAKFAGLYIFGSLVTGDFDYKVSDIDLVAATSGELNEQDHERLQSMHEDIAWREMMWDNRIEIHYISLQALRRYQPHYIQARISPGEPFNVRETDPSWVLSRRTLREHGITVFGPSIKTLIDPVSNQDIRDAIRDLKPVWLEYLPDIYSKGNQSFTVLTMCRALYTIHRGALVSKKRAAEWAKTRFPEWSPLIRQAILWYGTSKEEPVDDAKALADMRRFVHFALDQF